MDAQTRFQERIRILEDCAKTLHWMARRYADGRQSYATGLFNDTTRTLLSLGVELNPTGDHTFWARDLDGRGCDGLSEEEAAMAAGFCVPTAHGRDFLITALRDIADGRTASPAEYAKDIVQRLERIDP